ncbi:hypothetical protein Q604_UNBC09868G0001, partial [human gut metagenome]
VDAVKTSDDLVFSKVFLDRPPLGDLQTNSD